MPSNVRPRLIDVAARAGVSRTVASVALRGNGRVSEATRERVRRVAQEMGYIANPVARSLRQQRAGAIGLYLPAELTGHAYYMNFTFGVVDLAKANGLSVVLISPERDTNRYGSDSVDGYIVIDVSDDDEFVAGLLAGPLPVVSGESTPGAMPKPAGSIVVDHSAAIGQLLDHLGEQGAKRPAMIVPPASEAWSRQLRETYELPSRLRLPR
jgi:DNA-binding LacI/PurR family transcriptional regulator